MSFSNFTSLPSVKFCAFFTAMILLGGTVMASGQLPKSGVPQSCGMQTKSNNFNIKTINTIHDAGFKIIRRGFYWPGVEKEKGKYTFDEYDEQMNRCKELGLTVVGVLFFQHKDYEDDSRRGVTSEAGRKGFANFAAALAEHYKEYNVIWEVWNEPNTQTFWGKGKGNSPEFAKEYTDLVKEVVPAMIAKDPNVFVVAGSVSNYWQPSYDWTESCFKEGILKTGIRGWSVHPYGVKTPEEFEIGHKIMRNLLKKYGSPDMPLLDTERGFSVKKTREGWSGGSESRAIEFQAWNCVRQFMIDQMYNVPVTVWYEWDKKEGFGIEDKTGPNQALTACKEMFKELDGFHFSERIACNHYRDYLLLFEGPEGKRKIVAWTCPPRAGSPDNIEVHDVTLTVSGGSDLAGKFGEAKVEGNSVKINLNGKPKYIPVPAGVKITKCVSHSKFPMASAEMDQPKKLDKAVDLKLFTEEQKWEFTENTGKGSFKLAKDKDGKDIGIVEYDFTNPTGGGTPYVLAGVACDIKKGPMDLKINVRSPIKKQKLTFRLVDSTGQTHQIKTKIKNPGEWNTIVIPLNKRKEHWGGAKDGLIHYPIQKIFFSVPLPDPKNKTGKVEYSDIIVQ